MEKKDVPNANEHNVDSTNASMQQTVLESKAVQEKKQGFFTTSNITKIALFSALAVVMGLISFPVPFLPNFLKFNLADFIFLIATFCLGTTAGSVVVVIKVAFSLFHSTTGFVGELADLLCGLALVIPAGLIYKKWRTLKGAIWACVAATLCSTLVGIVCNWTFLVPLYARLYTWEGLLAPVRAIYSNVTQQNFYTIYLSACVLPFNLLRCIFASGVTLLVYKKLSVLLKKF